MGTDSGAPVSPSACPRSSTCSCPCAAGGPTASTSWSRSSSPCRSTTVLRRRLIGPPGQGHHPAARRRMRVAAVARRAAPPCRPARTTSPCRPRARWAMRPRVIDLAFVDARALRPADPEVEHASRRTPSSTCARPSRSARRHGRRLRRRRGGARRAQRAVGLRSVARRPARASAPSSAATCRSASSAAPRWRPAAAPRLPRCCAAGRSTGSSCTAARAAADGRRLQVLGPRLLRQRGRSPTRCCRRCAPATPRRWARRCTTTSSPPPSRCAPSWPEHKELLLDAGALGAVLSGSGPTLLGLAESPGRRATLCGDAVAVRVGRRSRPRRPAARRSAPC